MRSEDLNCLKLTNYNQGLLEVRFYYDGQVVNNHENKHRFANIISNHIAVLKVLVPEKQTYYLDVYSHGELKADYRFDSVLKNLPQS